MFNADRFTINTIVPSFQTAFVTAGTFATGKLLDHSVTLQTAALISSVASIVAAVADKFIDKSTTFRYALNLVGTSGLGALAGLAAHCFIYPTAPINLYAAGAFAVGLIAVRGVADFVNSRRTATGITGAASV